MRKCIGALFFYIPACIFAQNPGDNVFNTNQILTVELTFAQPDFWDSLVANYETETYMMADVTITSLTGVHSFASVGVRLKGNSSYGHPGEKKSLKIDFNEYVDGQEFDGLRKLNFSNCFKDPTFMREKIYYDICRLASVHAPRANYANVYMNGTFWGFYVVIEQVDDPFLESHFNDKSANLFKAGSAFGMGGGGASADLAWYGFDTAAYTDAYALENNTDANDWSDLLTLLDFINNSTDAEFTEGLASHFNTAQLMQSLALYNLFANLDSYINSARNYYIYNTNSAGVWEWINWDCNEAFGSYTGGVSTPLTELPVSYSNFNRPLMERILDNIETYTEYTSYYCALKTTYFTSAYIDNAIAELYTLIQDAVYADDNKMYTNEQFDLNIEEDITTGGGPGGGTIYGLKSFVTERNAFLEDNISCTSGFITNELSATPHIYPNPAQAYFYLQLPNHNTGYNLQLFSADGRKLDDYTVEMFSPDVLRVDLQIAYTSVIFIQLVQQGNVYTSSVMMQ
jgi:spore coat protein CotH